MERLFLKSKPLNLLYLMQSQEGRSAPRGIDRLLFHPVAPLHDSAQSFPSMGHSSFPKSTETGRSESSAFKSKETLGSVVSLPSEEVSAAAATHITAAGLGVVPQGIAGQPNLDALTDIANRGGLLNIPVTSRLTLQAPEDIALKMKLCPLPKTFYVPKCTEMYRNVPNCFSFF